VANIAKSYLRVWSAWTMARSSNTLMTRCVMPLSWSSSSSKSWGAAARSCAICGAPTFYYRGQQLSGPFQGQLVWKPAAEAAIYRIVKNPAYAGAFAYGRTRTDPARRQPGKRSTGIIQCPMDEWQHLQQDVYPAYITWDQYLANQERLRQGATQYAQQTMRIPGNPREGAALLQGLAVCGECGHRLSVGYKPKPFYGCFALSKRFDGPKCIWLPATPIDAVVVQAFFDALRPAQIGYGNGECKIIRRAPSGALNRDVEPCADSHRALNRVDSPALSARGRLDLAFSGTPQLGRSRDQRHAKDISDGENPVGET
jgi:hypothetical protein